MAVDTQSEECKSESEGGICSGNAEARRPSENGGLLSDRDALCTLLSIQQQSNRNWQLVVFPSLLAFILLAIYGFYLIYNLVEDVDKMASSVYLNLGFVAERMTQISQNLDALTGSVRDISVNLDDLTGTVTAMNGTVSTISVHMETLPPMLEAISDLDLRIGSMVSSIQSIEVRVGSMTASMLSMNNQMGAITVATQHLSGNVSGMNQSIGRPMNFMNSIMPW